MTRVALVTGGASGIGAATCRQLVADGWAVAVADRDGIRVGRLVEQLGAAALGLTVDVTDTAQIREGLGGVAARFGRLDAVITSAGVIDPGPSVAVTDEAWDRLLSVNLGGTFRVAREAHELLAKSGSGSVIMVSSIMAHVGMVGRASYAASKGGVEALTRVLATEWASDGIRVNAVAPGYVKTELVESAIADGIVDPVRLAAAIPRGQLADPQEIAQVVVFLAGDRSSFITGQAIVVDGGMTIRGSY